MSQVTNLTILCMVDEKPCQIPVSDTSLNYLLGVIAALQGQNSLQVVELDESSYTLSELKYKE